MLVLSIIFVLTLYFGQIFLFLQTSFSQSSALFIQNIIIVTSLIMPLINIVYAIIFGRKIHENQERLRKWKCNVLIIKIVLIPYFIVNFILWFLVTILGIVPTFMFLLAAAPIGMIYTFWIFIPTSIYAIVTMRGYYKLGNIPKVLLVFLVVSQLLFVIDIIGVIVFNFIIKYGNKIINKIMNHKT